MFKKISTVLFAFMLLLGLVGTLPAAAQDTSSDCIPGYDAESYGWGPAGPSPCSLDKTVEVLGLGSVNGTAVDLYVTVVNGQPGNPTPIGWIIATSGTEEAGTMFSANHLPSGVTVDFDPGAGELTGSYEFVDFRPDWRRAMLSSDGSFEGLKATVYWTPVDWAGFTPQSATGASDSTMPTPEPGNAGASEGTVTVGGGDAGGASSAASSSSLDCSPQAAAALFTEEPLSNASNWTQIGDLQALYEGPAAAEFVVPAEHSVDYDAALNGNPSGPATANEGDSVPAGATVFTLNCGNIRG